jgi:hypothetical protein
MCKFHIHIIHHLYWFSLSLSLEGIEISTLSLDAASREVLVIMFPPACQAPRSHSFLFETWTHLHHADHQNRSHDENLGSGAPL